MAVGVVRCSRCGVMIVICAVFIIRSTKTEKNRRKCIKKCLILMTIQFMEMVDKTSAQGHTPHVLTRG